MQDHVLVAAVKQGALILDIKGELYAASRYENLGWWVWKLEESAPEYFVTMEKCTCEAFAKRRKCKHLDALREGVVRKM